MIPHLQPERLTDVATEYALIAELSEDFYGSG
jgi:hypothetical protein